MNRNEAQLEHLLTLAGYAFERQGKAGGHRIDCLIGNIAVDVNGVWWHAKPKIIECDRVKLPRVVRAGVMPLGLWDSRVWKHPDSVSRFVWEAQNGHLAVWTGTSPSRSCRRTFETRSKRGCADGKTWKGACMEFVEPQLAHRGTGFAKTLLDDPSYVAEDKLDGLRMQVHVAGHRTTAVYSRTGKPLRRPGLEWLWAVQWKVESAVLDGEICGLHGTLATDVTHLIHTGARVALAIFDNLVLGNKSIMHREYTFRRAVLEEIVRVQGHPQFVATRMSHDKRKLLREVSAVGGEGIVMKRVDGAVTAWFPLPGLGKSSQPTTGHAVRRRNYRRDRQGYVLAGGVQNGGGDLGVRGVGSSLGKLRTVGQMGKPGSRAEKLRAVGKVAVVEAKFQFKTGALRHAHFRELRFDKPIQECVAPNDEQ